MSLRNIRLYAEALEKLDRKMKQGFIKYPVRWETDEAEFRIDSPTDIIIRPKKILQRLNHSLTILKSGCIFTDEKKPGNKKINDEVNSKKEVLEIYDKIAEENNKNNDSIYKPYRPKVIRKSVNNKKPIFQTEYLIDDKSRYAAILLANKLHSNLYGALLEAEESEKTNKKTFSDMSYYIIHNRGWETSYIVKRQLGENPDYNYDRNVVKVDW